MGDPGTLQPVRQALTDPPAGRIHDDGARQLAGQVAFPAPWLRRAGQGGEGGTRVRGRRRDLGGVSHSEADPVREPELLRGDLCGGHGVGTGLQAPDLARGAHRQRSAGGADLGQLEPEPAHSAVQVPDQAGVGGVQPGRGVGVELGGDRGVGLEEALRAQVQRQAVHAHGQGGGAGQVDLLGSLQQGLVLGQDVRGDDPGGDTGGGEGVLQLGQGAAQLGEGVRGAQHEAHHQLGVRGDGDDHVLELAGAGGDVIRGQTGRSDGAGDQRQGRGDPGLVQTAVAQVHAGAVVVPGVLAGVQDAQQGPLCRTGHHHLGLVAEPGLGAGQRLVPVHVRAGHGVQQLAQDALLVRHLDGVGHTHQRAGAAFAGIEVGTLHGGSSVPGRSRLICA